jgi:methionyl-tRNA formyltransferase
VKIIEAVPLSGEGTPGRVVAMSHEPSVPVGVQTGAGVLGLIQVQLEGKRVMSAVDFIRGQRDFMGAQLPS